MRASLALLVILLAVAFLWLFTRPQTPLPVLPETKSAHSTAVEPAGFVATPEFERTVIPAEEDGHAAYLATLPSTSLRVHISDPYEILSGNNQVVVETRLPNSTRAQAIGEVDASGECTFDKLPAGKTWISLLHTNTGGVAVRMTQDALVLVEHKPHDHLMDLNGRIAVVDLEFVNLKAVARTRVDLSILGSTFASWEGSRVGYGAQRAWIPLNEIVFLRLNQAGILTTTSEMFTEPGLQVWRIELPTGEVHLKWLPSDPALEFALELDPAHRRDLPGASVRGADGTFSFYWLQPGRYHLTSIHSGQRSSTGHQIEVGTEPIHLTLGPRPTGTLSFNWPELPRWAEPGQTNTRLVASLQPRGAVWPITATKSFSHLDEWRFEDVPAGDYDLVMVQAFWTSRTPVTVFGAGGEPAHLNPWRHQVDLQLEVRVDPDEPAVAEVRFIDADGVSRSSEDNRFGFQSNHWSSRFKAPSGASRLLVTRSSGQVVTFGFDVAEGESDQHSFELPK